MIKTYQQKGFTLVELAIVLTIIGLLIGGIVKGQQLIENARVTSTMAQIQGITAALNTFRDTYGSLPGDMLNADTRITDCGRCGLAVAATAGDGIVGRPNWDMAAFQSGSFTATASPGTATVDNETVLFWVEMYHAGLISGVNDDGINGAPNKYGTTLPSARIGGGFVVGYANVAATILGRNGYPPTMIGTALALGPTPPGALTATAAVQAITPSVAAQLDTKMDDGIPGTGSVQAYGVQTSCYLNAAAANAGIYDGSVASKNCGLYFKIDN